HLDRICFGAGCFWGTEKFFKEDFVKSNPSVHLYNGRVGYMGPLQAVGNPSYREVCSGRTGHVEVYDVEYSGGGEVLKKLCRHFFSFHDPTTLNRQGTDVGTQYASMIYCYQKDQIEIAKEIKNEYQRLSENKVVRYSDNTILTDILDATTFYPAEEEHQAYLKKNPGGYCNHFYRIDTARLPH
ncbi:unnamed protein product, partial [Ectocarpus fasciculatus]